MKVKTEQEIFDFLKPIADGLGIELIEVEFKQGKDPALTIYADTEEGIDLDTCAKLHEAINAPLDDFDPTFGAPYTLNVSSPGLDRPLKTERDFQKRMGQKVEVKLYAPLKGKKSFEAILVGYDGNCVSLEQGEETLKLELNKIAKICLAIDFD